jgi:putative YphP/YqiW family bacilliredoxin
MSLEGSKPDHLITVLQELTKMQLMLQDNTCSPFPPSSPVAFLFKTEVHMLERHHIEGPCRLIAENLKDAFNGIANTCKV